MIDKIKELGFDSVAQIPVTSIPFDPSLIKLCEMNTCGNYGKNYACPPYVGKTDELIEKARSYEKAIVFQKIYRLEDSFDIEGMNKGHEDFNALVDKIKESCEKHLDDYLVLVAGGCRKCSVCGVVDNVPCRFPDQVVASLESYGIFVSSLAEKCGMKYINGVNTVTYFGAVFHN